MAFNYTFRSDDISSWEADARDLVENRDRELELYSSTIDDSFLNLNANNLTSGTVPSTRITGSYSGITQVGTLSAGIASYSIGDTGPAGGKVFITPSTSGNTTGLYFEVAPVAAEVKRIWAQFSPINYQATSAPLAQFNTIGSGKSNTAAIVNQGNSNSSTCAAKYCDDYTYNGFSDWFLASKAELAEMYTNRVVLGNDFAPLKHWSSSQNSTNSAWYQDFGNGVQNYSFKGDEFYVRPVRSFSTIGLNVIGSTVVRAADTQDGVIITGGAFGIYNYAVTILPTLLTASRSVVLPDVSGTVITTGDTGTVTNTMLAGSITNAKLANSTISGISLGSNLATLTIGTGLSGTSYNGSTAATIALANTAVTAASYTNASITVDAQGRLTAASSGTSPVTTVTGTSPVVSSGGATPAISLAANYGDTLNPYAAKTAAFVLAGPTTGADAAPAFRAIVATDIPTLNQNTTGTASNITASSNTTLTSLANLTTVGTLSALRVDGNFGIGTSGLAQMGLWIGKAIGGSAFSQGIYMSGAIQSTVTTRADMIWTAPTVAASVTVPTVNQFYATLAGVGTGSTITTSVGFTAESNIGNNDLGTITNAYGFRGNLASGSGRYNLYMQGTAANYLLGRLGVGATLTSGAMAQINNTTAADKAFVIKGAASQSGDFLDVQNSGGTSQFKVDSTGAVGVSNTPAAGRSFVLAKTMTGSIAPIGFFSAGQIQSDATNSANYFNTFVNTAATAFTCGAAYHYKAQQGTIGAGSSIGTQVGFLAESSLIGATTNNLGFWGAIPADAAKNYNLYMSGTAPNYLAGSLGIGTTSLTGISFRVGKTITGAINSYASIFQGTVQADVTSQAYGVYASLSTTGTPVTAPTLTLFAATQGTLAGTVTSGTQRAYFADSNLIGATNNYAFQGAIPSGTGRYNLYMDGTAQNYLAGNLGVGVTVPTSKLHVVGSFSRGAPVTKTASFTLADSENWVICNGTATITATLPAASTQVGREISLKNIAAFTVVSASSNVVPLVGGAAGTAILPATAGTWATLVSDGTNWIIMQS